jgi:hypothetical protein
MTIVNIQSSTRRYRIYIWAEGTDGAEGAGGLTGRGLVLGFVDAPGRKDDIVAYADTFLYLQSINRMHFLTI